MVAARGVGLRGASWIAASAGLPLLILAIHRESARTLVSAHGLLHAAIVDRFLQDGLRIPPENPFLAGRPLHYYWGFHALAAAVARSFGLDPLHAMELLVVAAAAVLVPVAAKLARRLYGRADLGLVVAWLVVAGANPQAPLVLGFRLLRRGPEVLADSGSYLWGLVHPFSRAMRIADPYGLYGPLVSFFLNLTSRPLALVTLIGVVSAWVKLRTRGGPGAVVALAAATALCTAFSPPVGLGAAGALAAGQLVGWRGGRLALLRPEARVLASWLALGAGALLALPTYLQLVGGGVAGGALRWGWEGQVGVGARALATVASAWFTLGLALVGLRSLAEPARDLVTALIGAAAWLALANLLVTLPVGNQVNFFHAALVFLAVAGASAWTKRCVAGGCARGIALAAVFVPVFLLVLASYTGRPAVALEARDGSLWRTPADAPIARLYAWIQANTPRDAVLVIDPGPPVRAAAGNTAELPALTHRVILSERARHYIVAMDPESTRREAIVRRLLQADPLTPGEVADLERLGRPLFLVWLDPARESGLARLRRRYGPSLFEAQGLAVLRWDPERATARAGS